MRHPPNHKNIFFCISLQLFINSMRLKYKMHITQFSTIMKTLHNSLKLSLISFFLLITSAGCTFSVGEVKTGSSGKYITRNYKVKEFSKIDISTVGNAFYTQSTDGTTSLEIYGPESIIDLMQVNIENGTLTLSMKKKKMIKNAKNLKINIKSPNLHKLAFRGVGNVNLDTHIKTTSLTIDQQGVGDIEIKSLECKELNVSSEGVGNTNVTGTAETATLSARGVGNIEATRLLAKHVTASSEGVGNVSCYATHSINARAQGIGNIEYKGNPEETTVSKSGIGSVRKK